MAVSFIRDNAEAVMKASPISYVKDAELRGSLFDSKDMSGAVSSVYTKFLLTIPNRSRLWHGSEKGWSGLLENCLTATNSSL